MRTRIAAASALAALAALASLVAPGPAAAGCMATVGLAPPPPDLRPHDPWHADLVVRQHGVDPLRAAEPTLTIVSEETDERRTIAALPTETVGVYRATVVFPHAGRWRYEAFDGFIAKGGSWTCARTHTFAPVTIGTDGGAAAAAAARGGDRPLLALAAALGAGFLALALAAAARAGRPARARAAENHPFRGAEAPVRRAMEGLWRHISSRTRRPRPSGS